MSALPYQPVPTASQQRELERWVQRKYPVRQYRDNVDEAIADFQAARLRYELARLHSQPSENVLHAAGESCCAAEADEDEADQYPLPLFFAICIGALGLWGATAYATWWLVGTFLGVN